jgi:large subunit ribosomal protein L29
MKQENSPARLRELTEEELRTKVKSLHEEIFNLRFRNSVKQLDNPLKIREARRDLARMETLLAEHHQGTRRLADHHGASK